MRKLNGIVCGFICVSALLMVGLVAKGGEGVGPRMLLAGRFAGAVLMEDGKVVKKYASRGACQDAWMLKNGDVWVAEKVGVTKYDRAGEILFRYTTADKKREVHAIQPLAGGGLMISESGPARILELDGAGKIVKEIVVSAIKTENAHKQMRTVRKNKKGEYAIMSCSEMRLILLHGDGSVKKIIDLQKLPKEILHKDSHGFAFLDNGHMLVSTSFGSCFVELDAEGEVVWSLTPSDVPELELRYASGMHRLANGNTICTAYWSKYPVFEVTAEKEVVWKLEASEDFDKPTHVQSLDEVGVVEEFEVQR